MEKKKGRMAGGKQQAVLEVDCGGPWRSERKLELQMGVINLLSRKLGSECELSQRLIHKYRLLNLVTLIWLGKIGSLHGFTKVTPNKMPFYLFL